MQHINFLTPSLAYFCVSIFLVESPKLKVYNQVKVKHIFLWELAPEIQKFIK